MKAFKPAFQQKLQGTSDSVKLESDVKLSTGSDTSDKVSANIGTSENINKQEASPLKVSTINTVVPVQNADTLKVQPLKCSPTEPLKVSSFSNSEPLKVGAASPNRERPVIKVSTAVPLTVTPQSSSEGMVKPPALQVKPVALQVKPAALQVKPADSTNEQQPLAVKPSIKSVIPGGVSIAPKVSDAGDSAASVQSDDSSPVVKSGLKLPVGASNTKNEIIVNHSTGISPIVAEEDVPLSVNATVKDQNTPLAVTPTVASFHVGQSAASTANSLDDKLKAYFTNTENETKLGEVLQAAGQVSSSLAVNITNKIQHTNHSFDHITPRSFIGEVYKSEKNIVPVIIDHLIETTSVPFYDLSLFDISPDTKVSLNTAHKLGIIIWQCTEDSIQVFMTNPLDDDLINLLKELYDVCSVYKGIVTPEQLEHFYIEQKHSQVSTKGMGSNIGGIR